MGYIAPLRSPAIRNGQRDSVLYELWKQAGEEQALTRENMKMLLPLSVFKPVAHLHATPITGTI